MNKNQNSDKKADTQSRTSEVNKKGQSSSERATQEARKGNPLPAEKNRDRSPKQENL